MTEKAACRSAFGRRAFPVLKEVIVEDGNDVEAIRGVLELLHISVKMSEEGAAAVAAATKEAAGAGAPGPDLSELDGASQQVAELFAKEDANIGMLFGLLSTNQPISDFYTRYVVCVSTLSLSIR